MKSNAMPELFKIEGTNPLLSSGNVYDAATAIHRYAQFLEDHFLDDETIEAHTALMVLTDGTRKLRDALDAYHEQFTAWKEAREGGDHAES